MLNQASPAFGVAGGVSEITANLPRPPVGPDTPVGPVAPVTELPCGPVGP